MPLDAESRSRLLSQSGCEAHAQAAALDVVKIGRQSHPRVANRNGCKLAFRVSQTNPNTTSPAPRIGILCGVDHQFGHNEGDVDGAVRGQEQCFGRFKRDIAIRGDFLQVVAYGGKVVGKLDFIDLLAAVEPVMGPSDSDYPTRGLPQETSDLRVVSGLQV